MTPLVDIKRSSEESLDEYLVRIGDNLDFYGLNWHTAATLLNEHVEDDYSESKWRKDYAGYLRWKDHLVHKIVDSDEYIKEIQDNTIEMQKQKVQFQDQKREFSNVVRQQARFEHLKGEIINSIEQLSKVKPLEFKFPHPVKESKRAILLVSDWHVGSDFCNSLNAYNPKVFRHRIEQLVSKVLKYVDSNKVTDLVLANLGDQINGLIHVSSRVQSSEDVIRQTQIAAEVMAEIIATLSNVLNSVKVINICGNHARTIGNKTESVLKENFEKLIPWYLESRLKDFTNVEILTDADGYFVDEIGGEKFIYIHGDLDYVSSAAKNLPQMLGIVPKFIFSGHIHHNHVKEHGRTTHIVSGSLMGVDDYAISKRFYAEPMQKFMILDGSDVECTYDIKLK